MRRTQFYVIGMALLMTPGVASAQSVQNVTFDATIGDACTLTVTDGTLALSADAKLLGSEESGGSMARLLMSASGTPPKVQFDAPGLTLSPSRFLADAVEISYKSTNGHDQAYTAALTSVQETSLIDEFEVNARVLHDAGFPAGDYQVVTVATCAG